MEAVRTGTGDLENPPKSRAADDLEGKELPDPRSAPKGERG